jgi:hypothetical protein
MSEEFISELRQVLEEMVVPDLKLLIAKIDNLQRSIELSNKAFEARFDVLHLELEAMRSEMKTHRGEMVQLRAALGSQPGSRVQAGQQESSGTGEDQAVAADGTGKRWVN